MSSLTSINQILNVFEWVVSEVSAMSFMGVHQSSQAVKVSGILEFLVIIKDTGEFFENGVSSNSWGDLLFEFKVSQMAAVIHNLSS